MQAVLILIGAIVLVLLIFIVYKIIKVNRISRRLNAKRSERVKELCDKLTSGQYLTEDDVLPFARNVLARKTTYQLMKENNKVECFPKEYYTIVKAAESYLANWLEFPTELGACPDEMEHIKRVTVVDDPSIEIHYEVFKYRMNEPHWAANNNWILGVVGPYYNKSNPYDFPSATFSRISSTLDKVTPEEETKWVHENIFCK